LTAQRQFRLLFFDPQLAALAWPDSRDRDMWTVQVSAAAVSGNFLNADRALAVATAAGLALSIGIILTVRAVHASLSLSRLRSDFVSSVTHELKTPLATIRTAAAALVRGQLSRAQHIRDYALILDQEAKRLTRLVENILAYSKIVDKGEAYTFEPVALADVVDDALRAFATKLRSEAFEVKLHIPVDLPSLSADRNALMLVFDNLIDNAIRYSATDRELSISAWHTEKGIHISVADRGIGISETEIQGVVRRFVRGRNARSGGSGLGLAIVSKIVHDHGGEFSIHSQPGSGTTVDIILRPGKVDL
jgi:signal transduction histidine kinase